MDIKKLKEVSISVSEKWELENINMSYDINRLNIVNDLEVFYEFW